MKGRELCIWLSSLLLLFHGCGGQGEEQDAAVVEINATPVMPILAGNTAEALAVPVSEIVPEAETATDPAPQPEPAAEPAPEQESAAEPEPTSKPEPPAEPPSEPAEQAEEPAAESEAPSEPVPAAEPAPKPEPAAEPAPESAPPHEPEPTTMETEVSPTNPDYPNDGEAQEAVENPVTKSGQKPLIVPPVKLAEANLHCYTCSSDPKGKCVEKPTETMQCRKDDKAGCYTLVKHDSKLIMRGCISELSEEGDKYCRKDEKSCNLCYVELCNKHLAPPIHGNSVRVLGSFLVWILAAIALF